MSFIVRLIVLTLGLATLFFGAPISTAATSEAAPTVSVSALRRGPAAEEVTYEGRTSSCSIRWTVSRSGINIGTIDHRANCALPLADQMEVEARILDAILQNEPTADTIFLGSLAAAPEYALRLAVAAKQSPEWDARSGRPKAKHLTPFLDELLASGPVLAEWRALLQRSGRSLSASTEAADVQQIGRLPNAAAFIAKGLAASDRVPISCLVWLKIRK